MKIPRDISGRQLVQALCRDWNYRRVHQTGSHVVLETETPSHQRLAVPDHASLRIGTLNAMLRIVSLHKGVTREDIVDRL